MQIERTTSYDPFWEVVLAVSTLTFAPGVDSEGRWAWTLGLFIWSWPGPTPKEEVSGRTLVPEVSVVADCCWAAGNSRLRAAVRLGSCFRPLNVPSDGSFRQTSALLPLESSHLHYPLGRFLRLPCWHEKKDRVQFAHLCQPERETLIGTRSIHSPMMP